jgi:DNA-binding CsgD family transcriptional regulator
MRPIWDACTPRQRDVLAMLARTGGSNQEIGNMLGLSERQVKSAIRGIAAKLKIGTKRAALVVAYLDELTNGSKGRA